MANPKPKVTFEPVEMKRGPGWFVLVKLPGATGPSLGGFNTEAEANDWVKRQSSAWLKGYENGKYA